MTTLHAINANNLNCPLRNENLNQSWPNVWSPNIFSHRFILLRVTADQEPILGTWWECAWTGRLSIELLTVFLWFVCFYLNVHPEPVLEPWLQHTELTLTRSLLPNYVELIWGRNMVRDTVNSFFSRCCTW